MLAFFGKNSIFNQSNSVGAALEIFSLFSVFVGKKITINENASIKDHASRIWLPDCSKLAINWKNDNYAIFYGRGVNVNFFWRCRVFLVNVIYWSKFHVNTSTGSGVMTIFVYKGLIRSPEIGNAPAWFLLNIWILGQVTNAKFGIVSNEKRY